MSYRIESHEAAAIFPLMDGIELNQLVTDIREHGLLEPIVMFEGRVLDGRNRLRACELADVQPSFVDWVPNGSATPTEWVVSHNLHRRHLTVAQRAALALDLLPRLEAEARERQRGGPGGILLSPKTDEARGRTDEKAAALVGVGRSTVAVAKAIQNRDATGEIVQAMRSGDLPTVAAAQRRAGFEEGTVDGTGILSNGTAADGREQPTYFGKGDKWQEATFPLKRYLAAFEKRGFEFGHVNAKEAKKRVETIDQLIAALTQARSGLEERTHTYRLTA